MLRIYAKKLETVKITIYKLEPPKFTLKIVIPYSVRYSRIANRERDIRIRATLVFGQDVGYS